METRINYIMQNICIDDPPEKQSEDLRNIEQVCNELSS